MSARPTTQTPDLIAFRRELRSRLTDLLARVDAARPEPGDEVTAYIESGVDDLGAWIYDTLVPPDERQREAAELAAKSRTRVREAGLEELLMRLDQRAHRLASMLAHPGAPGCVQRIDLALLVGAVCDLADRANPWCWTDPATGGAATTDVELREPHVGIVMHALGTVQAARQAQGGGA